MMIIFLAEPKLFDQFDPENSMPELGELVATFGYTLKFSWKSLFLDWMSIKPYDGKVDITDFFAI